MAYPTNAIKKFLFRIGKQIEPVIRLPDDGSVVDIRTNTIRDENIVWDTYKNQGWEIAPGQKVHAVYIDGIFKGHGHFVTDEGVAVKMAKEQNSSGLTPGPAPAPGPGSSHTITPARMDLNGSLMGKALDLHKNVSLFSSKDKTVITARYEGHIGTLSGINMIQRGSVLQPSMWSTLIWCLLAFMLGGTILPMVFH